MTFAAVVLAGQRPGARHPVAIAAGVAAAVLAPVAGRPMLARVLDALHATTSVNGGLIVGDNLLMEHSEDVARSAQAAGLGMTPAREGPSASARAAVQTLQHFPCLITTADHPLLTPAVIDEFCAAALRSGADVAVAMVRHRDVTALLPDTRRTAIAFADGGICGCNLFAVCTPRGVGAIALWQQVEADRKRPWRVIRMLGLRALLAYLLRRLTATAALARLSELAGCQITFVELSAPEMAVDVDSVADWQLVERLFAARSAAGRAAMPSALVQPAATSTNSARSR